MASDAVESGYEGIFFRSTGSAKSPYGAYYYTPKARSDGRSKSVAARRRFAEIELREKWAADIHATRVAEGKVAKSLDPARRKRWEIAEAMIGGADPVEVASFWMRNTDSGAALGTRQEPVSAILAGFLDHRKPGREFRGESIRIALQAVQSGFREFDGGGAFSRGGAVFGVGGRFAVRAGHEAESVQASQCGVFVGAARGASTGIRSPG